VTAGSAVGPLCVVAQSDQGFALSLLATVMAVALAAAGWLAGVLVFRHPVLLEFRRVVDELPEVPLLRQLLERAVVRSPRAGEAR
jgi:hypothetical protein